MRIVTYKTAFYSFYLPVVCGLLVGGTSTQEAFAVAKDICIEMGRYFQVRRSCLKTLTGPSSDKAPEELRKLVQSTEGPLGCIMQEGTVTQPGQERAEAYKSMCSQF